jgi:HEPN domain-containing protein
VAIIRDRCPAVQMIILFGSYARGDWKEARDLAPDRKSGHVSDYDILAITEGEADCSSLARHEVTQACNAAGLSATPRFIYHTIEYVNARLERGQYFFSDIVAEGKLLYDAGQFQLATRRDLSAAERLGIAREDFSYWFENANRFFQTHQFSQSKGWLKESAFNLHQAAEAAYKTTLLVFTGYIPDEHYLALLGAMAAKVDPAFRAVFPRENDFERNAFTALEYAYIGARYDKRYTIDEPTLNYLTERVAVLVELVGEHCRAKIAALEQTAGER